MALDPLTLAAIMGGSQALSGLLGGIMQEQAAKEQRAYETQQNAITRRARDIENQQGMQQNAYSQLVGIEGQRGQNEMSALDRLNNIFARTLT
jgi:hypothetical protein